MRKHRFQFAGLKVRTSLIIVLAFFLVMLVAGAALGVLSLRANNQALETVVTNQQLSSRLYQLIDGYKTVHVTLGRAIASAVVHSDQQPLASALERGGKTGNDSTPVTDESRQLIAKARAEFETAMQQFAQFKQQVADKPDTRGFYRRVIDGYDNLMNNGVKPLFDLLLRGQVVSAHEILGHTITDLQLELYNSLASVQHFQQGTIDTTYQSQTWQYNLVVQLVGVGMLACVLTAVMAYLFLGRMVLQPLRDAGRHFERIASGDLTEQVQVPSRNEIGVLFDAVRRMQDSLTRTVATVRDGVEQITYGSREIYAGNTDIRSRTEQQGASLQETAASMAELARTVRQNAEHAQQADTLVRNAAQVAQQGGQAVEQVVSTMETVSASAGKMSDIVTVIDGIAFQTNILALNAAVEAARAGEQGKGFAVVAGEVRSLAQRSAQAAKEIKALIETSVQRVQAGTRQADDAGRIMAEVVQSVEHVTRIMAEISEASHEQSDGIEKVNLAVNEMDAVVQHNTALVQQATAAAGSLQSQAERLLQSVEVFKLSHDQLSGRGGVHRFVHESRANTLDGGEPYLIHPSITDHENAINVQEVVASDSVQSQGRFVANQPRQKSNT